MANYFEHDTVVNKKNTWARTTEKGETWYTGEVNGKTVYGIGCYGAEPHYYFLSKSAASRACHQ